VKLSFLYMHLMLKFFNFTQLFNGRCFLLFLQYFILHFLFFNFIFLLEKFIFVDLKFGIFINHIIYFTIEVCFFSQSFKKFSILKLLTPFLYKSKLIPTYFGSHMIDQPIWNIWQMRVCIKNTNKSSCVLINVLEIVISSYNVHLN
jgi:hypothetical protein